MRTAIKGNFDKILVSGSGLDKFGEIGKSIEVVLTVYYGFSGYAEFWKITQFTPFPFLSAHQDYFTSLLDIIYQS